MLGGFPHVRRSVRPFLASLCLFSTAVQAARLPSTGWIVRDGTSTNLRAVVDSNLETLWTSTWPQRQGLAIEIDLGREALVHRVYLTPGPETMNFPRSLRVLFTRGPSAFFRPPWQPLDTIAQANAVEMEPSGTVEMDLRFDPVQARYIRMEIGSMTCGLPWSIAELEVYGTTEEAAFEKRDAVVLETDTPGPLQTAARDLRYYIGELTGQPIPIVPPAREAEYPGTLYKVIDLSPLAKTYEDMAQNQKDGKLPKGVNVERNGREVLFRAWPYEMALSSVWEFLERQGVRWVYPEPQGDFVPAGKGVDLGILPLRYEPPVTWRYANFETEHWRERPIGSQYLYFWRNRWNSTWAGHQIVLGGAEVPKPNIEKIPQVGKGFEGYPHNFASVVPDDVLKQHPDWCGMLKNTKYPNQGRGVQEPTRRLPPSQGGPTFCMSNPEVIEWVAKKAIDSVGGNPAAEGLIRLMPMDSALFCECDECMKLYEPLELDTLCFEWGGRMSVSDAFYHFVSEVAKRVGEKLPKVQFACLAYANYHKPPRKIEKLPANLRVQVCLYGAMTLPLTHPKNAEMKSRLDDWYRKCPALDTYSYVLIHGGRMPVPLVTALADWMQNLHRMDALGGGSQASMVHLPINPWNFYAFPRYAWKPDTPAGTVLGDFFTGYYQEASAPMLAYYKTIEDHILKEGVNIQEGMYGYGPKAEAYTEPVLQAMGQRLAEAEKAAQSWVVRKRLKTARDCYLWTTQNAARRRAGPENPEARGRKAYPCYRIQGNVQIDGVLDDAAWQTVPPATGFTAPGTGRIAIVRQTEFRMAWDDKNLYVAVRCQEPKADRIDPTSAKSIVFYQDSMELFLAPKLGNPTEYYRLALSAAGAKEGPDLYLGDMYNAVKRETPACATAAKVGNGFWTCEAAIPFEALGGAPQAGAAWLGNLCRNTQVAGQTGERYTTWTALPFLNWHNYREFNSIRFLPDPASADAAKAADEQLNGEFRRTHALLTQQHTDVEAIIRATEGAPNLATNVKDAPWQDRIQILVSAGLNADKMIEPTGSWDVYHVGPHNGELRWPKPVAFDTVILRFAPVSTWYALEYWDGQQYRLLAEDRKNALEVRAHQFPAVEGTRLRIQLVEPWTPTKGMSRIEVYNLGLKQP